MKRTETYLLVLSMLMFSPLYSFAQGGGGCSPTTGSGSCGSAQSLTVGASCVNGTTCGGGAEDPANSCLYAGSECSWYSFTASATDMFVEIAVSSTDGCHISSSVYSGSCGSLTEVSCESGAPLDDLHSLTGLTVGNTYYVQVCYAPGGPCGNGGKADYCIKTGEPDPPCETCSNPCGTAQGYTSAPPVDTVVEDCETSPFSPELQPGSTHTFCYSLEATDTDVDFNVIITSDCGSGNVTNFSWELFEYPSCGGAIQTGDLSNLTFSGLTVGDLYVFCYTFTVPSSCTHSQHCPYFVGAQQLPVELLSFEGEATAKGNRLSWVTGSEQGNSHFLVQRSAKGDEFETIDRVEGQGTSSLMEEYRSLDRSPLPGTNYYRLEQVDLDGRSSQSEVIAVKREDEEGFRLYPNPVRDRLRVEWSGMGREEGKRLLIFDPFGRKLKEVKISPSEEDGALQLSLEELPEGLYFLEFRSGEKHRTERFIKKGP